MVEQGVRAALTEKEQEDSQKDRENEGIKNQIREMRALFDSMNVANTAQQLIKPIQQSPVAQQLVHQSPQGNVQPLMQQGKFSFYPQQPYVQFNPLPYYGN